MTAPIELEELGRVMCALWPPPRIGEDICLPEWVFNTRSDSTYLLYILKITFMSCVVRVVLFIIDTLRFYSILLVLLVDFVRGTVMLRLVKAFAHCSPRGEWAGNVSNSFNLS